MTKETSNNENGVNDPWSVHLEQWRTRLKRSASVLHQVSFKLQETVSDERRFSLLTDLSTFYPPPKKDKNKESAEEKNEFHRLLEEALTALIDLTSYNNPEQEYPDLTTSFQFECPNVIFGKHTDRFRIPPPRP